MPYSKEKPVILVDADGVLGDFDAAVASRLDRLNVNVSHPLGRGEHNILSSYPEEYREQIQEIIHSHDFFNEIPLYEDALEGWGRLLSLGYDPVVCTSPIPNNKRSIEAKKEWIRDSLVPHFGASALTRAHITLDKHQVSGYALIDDRPTIPHTNRADWQHVVFSHSYNIHIDTSLRLNGWRDDQMKTVLGRVGTANLGLYDRAI